MQKWPLWVELWKFHTYFGYQVFGVWPHEWMDGFSNWGKNHSVSSGHMMPFNLIQKLVGILLHEINSKQVFN